MASRTQVKRDQTEQPSYNKQMRANKLRKLGARAQAWRTRVYAEQGLRIAEINEQLAEMGQPPLDLVPFDPYDEESFKDAAQTEIPPK